MPYPNLGPIPQAAPYPSFDDIANVMMQQRQQTLMARQQQLEETYRRMQMREGPSLQDPSQLLGYPTTPSWYPAGGQGGGPSSGSPGAAPGTNGGIQALGPPIAGGAPMGPQASGQPAQMPSNPPQNPGTLLGGPTAGPAISQGQPGPEDHFARWMARMGPMYQGSQSADPNMQTFGARADARAAFGGFMGSQELQSKMGLQGASAYKDFQQGNEAASNAVVNASLFGTGGAATPGGSAPGGSPNMPDGVDLQSAAYQDALAVIQGRKASSQIATMRGKPYAAAVHRFVNLMAPNFDWEASESNFKGKVEFQTGQNSPGVQQPIKLLESIGLNLDRLEAISGRMNLSNFRPAAKGQILWRDLWNDSDVIQLKSLLPEVQDQIAKIMQGGGTGSVTSDAKLKQASGMLREDSSPNGFSSAVSIIKDALGSRQQALTDPGSFQPAAGAPGVKPSPAQKPKSKQFNDMQRPPAETRAGQIRQKNPLLSQSQVFDQLLAEGYRPKGQGPDR